MKKRRKTTFGLRLDQLADLFAVAADNQATTESNCTNERLSKMLRRQITKVLTDNELLFQSSAKDSDNERCDLTSLAGRSLLQVLLSPETSIKDLQLIKQGSKHLTITSVLETDLAISTTIYYAAIASCLLLHGKKITQLSYEKLVESFTLLIDKKWMSFELVDLFSQARDVCQKKRVRK
jgi:hypothetical protein